MGKKKQEQEKEEVPHGRKVRKLRKIRKQKLYIEEDGEYYDFDDYQDMFMTEEDLEKLPHDKFTCFNIPSTKEEHQEYYKKLLENPKNNTLSTQALETLAIIAYNEPITRIEVDELRGVDSVYVMRRLLAKGLIKESGRSDKPGHPIMYKTTDEFLDYFGLSSKEELPKIKQQEKFLD